MPDTPSVSPSKAWIITGPTSGFGRRTALELAKHGSVVLVGRDPARLAGVRAEIQGRPGGHAEPVVCDLSDIESVRRAAAEIVTLDLPIAGVLNNAGIMPIRPGRSAQGWDLAYATNHLGPFAFTEALIPHLPDGANVVFTCSGVEDPERKPAVTAGFRGGRYISAEASARGEWAPGGSSHAGLRRLRHLQAVRAHDGLHVRAGDAAAALQRRRARLQPGHRPRPRREPRPPVRAEVPPLATRAAHQVLEHPRARRPRHHHRS